eukprot:scaffold152742_cov18-Tisochrysis_lutea.AAC.2
MSPDSLFFPTSDALTPGSPDALVQIDDAAPSVPLLLTCYQAHPQSTWMCSYAGAAPAAAAAPRQTSASGISYTMEEQAFSPETAHPSLAAALAAPQGWMQMSLPNTDLSKVSASALAGLQMAAAACMGSRQGSVCFSTHSSHQHQLQQQQEQMVGALVWGMLKAVSLEQRNTSFSLKTLDATAPGAAGACPAIRWNEHDASKSDGGSSLLA